MSAADTPTMKSGCRLPAPASMDAARSLEQYKVRKQLYKGQTSMVLEATDRGTGAHVVLKVYSKRLMGDVDRNQLEREMDIHGSLKHEHIIDLITVFEDDRAVYLVQSYAQGGDLFSALHAAGCLDESRTAGTIIAPLLSALDYIHAKGIIHRDIKVENILLDLHGEVKLADFGLAIDCHAARPRSRLGTWEYMAPEVHLCPFKGSEEYDDDATPTYSSSADVWSVGILAFELLVGRAPFQQDGDGICYKDLMSRDLTFPSSLSPEACSFIRWTLCKQARHRPSARQLLRHRWLRPYLKAELLEDEAAPPPPAARPHGTRSLPLEALHEVTPAPAETDVDAAVEFTRRTPINPSARGSACSACPSPKVGAASGSGGLFATPSKSPNPALSPTTPLSYTRSNRTSEESSASCSTASTCPSPGAPMQQPSRGGSGALAAATAGLLRRLPSKIQSLMNLSLNLGGRASRAENQVMPVLATSLPSSPNGTAPAGSAPAKGSRASYDCDKGGAHGAGMPPGAAAWAEASRPTGRCSSVCCDADEARGRLLHSAVGLAWSGPPPLVSGPAAHEPKPEGWIFARRVGRLGRRSMESLAPHGGAAAAPGLSWQRPLQLAPRGGSPLPAAPAAQPGARQGPVRRSLSDKDLGASLALAKQAHLEPAVQTLEPAPPSSESREGGRSRHVRPAARLRSVTCSDLQLQLLLGSEDQLWSVGFSSASPQQGAASQQSPQQSSGMNIPGSTDSNACLSSSGGQLQGAAAGTAAAATARDDAVAASWLPSQTPGGESSLPSTGAHASEAGQPLRGAGRSRARRLYLLPSGGAYQ